MAALSSEPPKFTVFLSSPSDVFRERQIIKDVIQEINADPAWQSRCTLIPLAYEDKTASQMGKPAQRIVDEHMRKACDADIVVCIFCNRLGTPTLDQTTGESFKSGTHYEFDSAYKAFVNGNKGSPRVMLYLGYRALSVRPTVEEREQYNKAQDFKTELKSSGQYEGLYFEYEELSEFQKLLGDHLRKHLNQMLSTPQSFHKENQTGVNPLATNGYLGQIAEKFRWLDLQGIREAGVLRIELEKVYVALKAEPESEYDRKQSAKLHAIEVQEIAGVEKLEDITPAKLEKFDAANIRKTHNPAREENKRASITEVRTLGDAFRQHHRAVILGGPGSGKTTLGRWLALQLARAFARQIEQGTPQRVMLPAFQINPDAPISTSKNELVDLGPARLPIFLRLSHFARELASRAQNRQPTLGIVDYLGHDPDSQSLADGFTPETRNALFRQYLKDGQAVIILDGLDELPEANLFEADRRSIVLKIQDFIEKHIPPNRVGDTGTIPYQDGGNQVVITSRYVGYKFASIQSDCIHFGIQPMQRNAVEKFVYSWTEVVNLELDSQNQPLIDPQLLIEEIYNDARPAVRELATNPLLVTVLATIYWRDGQLPDQRADVYHRIVENMLRIWWNRQEPGPHRLSREELLAVLEPLAADMQENAHRNGLIELARIGEIVEGPLAQMRGIKPTDPMFVPIQEGLLGTIRKHVGLLVEQSNDNYGFSHRQIQEFLAARHLLANRTTAAQKIADCLDDPVWREPLALALEFAMIDPRLGPETRTRFLKEVLAIDGKEALIPRATLLFLNAVPGLRDVPEVIVGQTVTRLLTAYSITQDQDQALVLREQIESAFEKLRNGKQADVVVRHLAKSLRHPLEERDLSCATAAVLRRINWFTLELIESLLAAIQNDQSELDWPIRRALIAALGTQSQGLSWITAGDETKFVRFLGTNLPMRRLFDTNPELVNFVRTDADWLWLLVALYGGVTQPKFEAQIREHQQKCVDAKKPPPPTPNGIGFDEVLPPLDKSFRQSIDFRPEEIVHDLADAELSRLIQRHLSAQKPARNLLEIFRQRWLSGNNPTHRAEALIGLAALGEDAVTLLKTALTQPAAQPAARAAVVRFRWLKSMIRGPLLNLSEIAARTLPEQATEYQQYDLLNLLILARVDNGGSPLPISDSIPKYRYVAATSPELRSLLEAEHWSFLFGGAYHETEYPAQQVSSVIERLTQSPELLIHSFSSLAAARNQFSATRLAWPSPALLPRPDSSIDHYLAMLDALSDAPKEFSSTAGYLLGRCIGFLESQPDLVWETLAVCLQQGAKFIRGYIQGAHERRGECSSERCIFGRIADMPSFTEMDEMTEDEKAGVLIVAFLLPIRNPRVVPHFSMTHVALHSSLGVEDRYLRFRAQWRFLGEIIHETENLTDGLTGLIDEITDPHQRVCILEWIFSSIFAAEKGILQHTGLVEPVLAEIGGISDAENRARAQCRVAFLAPNRLESLLKDALESVKQITNPRRQSQTIQEIREVWGRMSGVSENLETIAQSIQDEWERAKALNRPSRLIQAFRQDYATHPMIWRLPPNPTQRDRVYRSSQPVSQLAWGLHYLWAVATEVEPLGDTPTNIEANWDRLLGPDRSNAVAAIISTGLENGIPVGAREISILQRILESGQGESLDPLWPYLDKPDPNAMGTVARWAQRMDRAGQWAALVQAEGGRLTPEIATGVINLLGCSTDRLHLRACLALHGPNPTLQNTQRRWSVKRVGVETIEAIAQQASQGTCSPCVNTALNWTRADIFHDDREAMETWVSQADFGDSASLCWIFRSLQRISDDILPAMLKGFKSDNPEIHEALLAGLSMLTYISETSNTNAPAIHNAVSQLPTETRFRVRSYHEGPANILASAQKAIDSVDRNSWLSFAIEQSELAAKWLNDESLADPTKCLSQLKDIGRGVGVQLGDPFSGVGSYWNKAEIAATKYKGNNEIIELLLDWVASLDMNEHRNGVSHHVLTALESLARHSPDAFAHSAKPEQWEPVLTDWTQFADNWTSRMAAVSLLGRLRRVTDRVTRAFCAAVNDVSFVQQAAYRSVSELRRIEGDILTDVLQLLNDPSTAVAASAAKLLTGVSRNDVSSGDRRRILRNLQIATSQSSITRPVYLMEETGIGMSIKKVDLLNRVFYRAIFEISGL